MLAREYKKTGNRKLAIDLFSGCGGLSCGLKQAGFDVIGAVEIDPKFASTYSANHRSTMLFNQDIRKLNSSEILTSLGIKKGDLDLLAGCPPCQGFSTLGTRNKKADSTDERNKLINDFKRLVLDLKPKAVMLENVPGLYSDPRFKRFCTVLRQEGYFLDFSIVNVADFGVPQRRNRLILLASRIAPIRLASPGKRTVTVRQAIGALGKPGNSGDILHDLPRKHSDKVLRIFAAIPKDGGSRRDLPKDLVLECHKKSDGFKDVYGRMAWDSLAPTITSGCTNPSKGRFIHPEQNRAITLREAAILQGFPKSYKFLPEVGLSANSLMIGNALPPPFICVHAKVIMKNLASRP